MSQPQKRLSDLINYVKKTTRLSHTSHSNMEKHDWTYTARGTLDLPGVTFHAYHDDDLLFSITKPAMSPPPLPDNALLRALVKSFNNPRKPLKLENLASLTDLQKQGCDLRYASQLSDDPSVLRKRQFIFELNKHPDKDYLIAEFNAFIKEHWQPWADRETPIRAAIELYDSLFKLLKDQQSANEDWQSELLLGAYVLTTKKTNPDICYPLITRPVQLSMDDQFAIQVWQRGYWSFESDVLMELNYHTVDADGEELLNTAIHPHNLDMHLPQVKRLAMNIDSKVTIVESNDANTEEIGKPKSGLTITSAWCMLIRKRSMNLLESDLSVFESKLDACHEAAVIDFVSDVSAARRHFSEIQFRGMNSIDNKPFDQELYFPKPYNAEQFRVIELLEASRGVVVQGPPGTGKSHTIANIVSHYLANGKRVLVTSMKEQALSVVHEKLPAKLRQLSLAQLSTDAHSLKLFDKTLSKLSDLLQSYDERDGAKQILDMERVLNAMHTQRAELDGFIEEYARANLSAPKGMSVAEALYCYQEVNAFNRAPFTSEVVLKHARTLDSVLSQTEIQVLYASVKALQHDLPVFNEQWPVAAVMQQIVADASRLVKQFDNKPVQLFEPGSSEDKAFQALVKPLAVYLDNEAALLTTPITFPEVTSQIWEQIKETVIAYAKGEDPIGFYERISKRVMLSALSAIKISGRTPQSSKDWQRIERYMSLTEKRKMFYAGVAPLLKSIGVTVSEQHCFADCQKLLNSTEAHTDTSARSAAASALYSDISPYLNNPWLMALYQAIHAVEHPLAEKEDIEYLVQCVNALTQCQRTLHQLMPAYSEITRLQAKLDESISLLTTLCQRADDSHDFVLRHKALLVSQYYAAMPPQDIVIALMSDRAQLVEQMEQVYEELTYLKALHAMHNNTTPEIKAALKSYQLAVVKLGNGKGIRAARYKKAAQEAAALAVNAVPVWILPHYKVSEALPAEFGMFDLVIIDEASQSDLTTLPILFRAKKLLIVGDNRQVSPDGAGLSEEKIKGLMTSLLSDQVPLYAPHFSPDKSVYDLCSVVYSDYTVMLKEHFRCDPAIIEFSRREVYDYEIIPLRKQRASERMDPPLVDVYLPKGMKFDKINKLEANYIVNEIKKIIVNNVGKPPKSIGVVSLLGPEQADLVMDLITKSIDVKDIELHQIACGDPKSFQGKERDIIFLSMVVDHQSHYADGKETARQRYNVAASRAKDRMYLVRSTGLDSLSNRDIYRRALIEHFSRPFIRQEPSKGKALSTFEQAIATALVEKGIEFKTRQIRGNTEVPIVIEYADQELLVFCDHATLTVSQYQAAIASQRILERAGHRCIRIFEVEFTIRREEVMQLLFDTIPQLF